MYVSSLTLKSFRNYEHEKLSFSTGTNLIYGNNAQGKTNILEAVYLFSHGRSHRTKQDSELIKFNAPFALEEINFFSHERDFVGQMVINRNGKKQIKINNIVIPKLSELLSYLNIVLFSPEDLSLIKGSPAARRKFMDSSISQLYPKYMASLISYQKNLNQKNALLKMLKRTGKKNDATLSAWNTALAHDAEIISDYREKFIALLAKFAKNIQAEISSENLELSYVPNISPEENIFQYLECRQAREIEYASSLFGIQRDDISITVGGCNSRLFCSQGQQRTASLSMKIAQADFIHHIKNEYPVILLDDIMSELDKNRRNYLWQKIKNKQVLITCTDIDNIPFHDNVKKFHVSDGKIKEEA